jgi:RHS repeat-associated protein
MLDLGAGNRVEDLGIAHQVDVAAHTGAASLRVPIPLPAGRSGVQPALALVYSGRGNSAFGVGWALSGVPTIGIHLRRRVPRWDGADPFQFGGDELTPWCDETGTRRGDRVDGWSIAYYRSRYGTTPTRVERWVDVHTARTHFRTRDARNVVTTFGAALDGSSRIEDPDDSSRTLSWLPELQIDPHGNAIAFEWIAENAEGLDRAASFEPSRPCVTQRYLKRVRYGNTIPLDAASNVDDTPWCFEIVFDYGEHGSVSVEPDRSWASRPDPQSVQRAGFPIRTHRLCRRILIAHRFAELGNHATVVTAIELIHDLHPAGSTLREIHRVGYRDQQARRVPPLRMQYSERLAYTEGDDLPVTALDDVPAGFADHRHTFVDLYGEGVSGILTEIDRAWYYKRNLGDGAFAERVLVEERPSARGSFQLGDIDRDGDTELVSMHGRMAGRFELSREETMWSGFVPFASFPHVEALGGRAQWIDLNGDGRTDLVIAREDSLVWFASDGDGFLSAVTVPHPVALEAGAIVAADAQLDLAFADMNGDGLADLVRIRNGCVEYWPSLGNGRFGERVVMEDAPWFAPAQEFDSSRLRFVDLDGSGTSDLLYLGNGEVKSWTNCRGNRFSPGVRIGGLPVLDQMSSVRVLDFYGDGRSCLVWSSSLPGRESSIRVIPLVPAVPPRFLVSVENSLGQVTHLSYTSSARHYLRDLASGRGWSTRLPHHTMVVERREVIDELRGGRAVTRYAYHDGFYDGDEQELRGFAHVDVYDADVADATDDTAFAAPALNRTWFHLGTEMWNHHRPYDTYEEDPDLPRFATHVVRDGDLLRPEDRAAALRAIEGRVVRRETFAVDETDAPAPHPFEVAQASWEVRCLPGDTPAFLVAQRESATWIYEQEPRDPRVSHQITIDTDERGFESRTASIHYARRATSTVDTPAQTLTWIDVHDHHLVHVDRFDRFELATSLESRRFQLVGIAAGSSGLIAVDVLRGDPVRAALLAPLPFHMEPTASVPTARLVGWDKTWFWNASRSGPLDFGDVGELALVHHEESACFTPELVEEVFGTRVDRAALLAAGYLERDGLWWQVDAAHVFSEPTEFSLRIGLRRGDLDLVGYLYDAYHLAVVSVVDAVGNIERADIDYHVLAPMRVTDPNGNTTEARFDSLGVRTRVTASGHVGTRPWGQTPMAALPPGGPSVSETLASPDAAVGEGLSFLAYDLDRWARDRAPNRVVSVLREGLVRDGTSDTAAPPRTQTSVTYIDGFGRHVQQKGRVDEDRWLVSGQTVFDTKQRPVLRYEPFFSTSPEYESNASYGAAALTRYDAVGRAIGVDEPDGTYSRTDFRAWTTTTRDRNDTVASSTYRALHESEPADSRGRAAYESAARHADTPAVEFLDSRGQSAGGLAIGGADAPDRRTAVELDAAGNIRRIVDARGLSAFTYRYDMAQRRLLERSVDAGETRTFFDGHDRVVVVWSARGDRIERHYDNADRLITTDVVGNGVNHRVEENQYGDSLVDRADAIRRNLLCRLVRVRDASGELAVDTYDPRGQPMSASRRLRREIDNTPDWRQSVALEPDELSTSAVYDALGRARSEVLPDGTMRAYEYAAQGHLEQIRVTLPDGSLVDEPILDGATSSATGDPESATLGNGIRLEYAYDPITRRLDAQRARRGTRLLQALEYTYDPVGNVVRITDAAHEGTNAIVENSAVSARREYRYDAHYRLREANGRVHRALLPHDFVPGSGGTVKGTRQTNLNDGQALERFTRSYQYDASGNVMSVRHAGDSHSWRTDFWISGLSNRSIPALDANGIPVTSPETTFDARGNLIATEHLRRLEWTWRGELGRAVSILRPGSTDDAEAYIYSGAGTRVRKVATRIVHGGQVEVTEKTYLGHSERKRIIRNGSIIFERWTTHVHDATRRIATIHRWVKDDLARETDVLTSRVHYRLSTHQGSSALELDATGAIISYEEYFPYGGSAFVAGDQVREIELREYRYSDKECDESGLYYYGHRYYAPWLHRWISPDPSGPVDHLNLYQFVLGDPVGNVDRRGLDTTTTTKEAPPIQYKNVAPVATDPTADPTAAMRALLVANVSKAVADYDNLSQSDQLAVAKGEKFFVRRNVDMTGPFVAITKDDYVKRWAPGVAKHNIRQKTRTKIYVPSASPNSVMDTLNTGLPVGQAAEIAPDPWDSGEKGPTPRDGTGKDDADVATEGDGSGGTTPGDGSGDEGAGEGDGTGDGAGSAEGTGAPGTTGSKGGLIGGREGGDLGGVLGGTPYARGQVIGGRGTSNRLDLPRDGGSGLHRGRDFAGNSTTTSKPAEEPRRTPGNGNRGGQSTVPASRTATGLGKEANPNRGQRPGGRPDGKPDGRAPQGWKDVALDVAGILSFSFSDKDAGRVDGVPGGLGWIKASASWAQYAYIATSFVAFLDLAITGLGAVLSGLGQLLSLAGRLLAFLLRAGWMLLTKLPSLLRLGVRGLARLGIEALRAARYLASQALSSGFRWGRQEILAAFKGAAHTPMSLRVLEALESGALKVVFRVMREKAGFVARAGKMYINKTMSMDDILNTMVHEGTHALDLGKGIIPPFKSAGPLDVALAELRAFWNALKFAEKNGFAASGMGKFFGYSPASLLNALAMKYRTFAGELLDDAIGDGRSVIDRFDDLVHTLWD